MTDFVETQYHLICRELMTRAYERGWADDAVWALNEHELLGMEPKLDRTRVLEQIRERAEERKALRRQQAIAGEPAAATPQRGAA